MSLQTSRLAAPVLAGAACAAMVICLFTVFAEHVKQTLSARAGGSTVTLRLTLPTHEALGCGSANAPCNDLDSVFLYRQDRYQQPRIVQRARVTGLEGQPWAFDVPAGDQAVYYVAVTDTAGNESCASNLVQVAGAVSVPIPTPRESTSTFYDIAGRKVSGKPRPGVYLERVGAGPGKRVVVLR